MQHCFTPWTCQNQKRHVEKCVFCTYSTKAGSPIFANTWLEQCRMVENRMSPQSLALLATLTVQDFQKSTTRDDLSRTGDLDQDHIWRQFNSFLRKDDFIIAEVGSSQFGTLGMNLPDGCGYISQFFYSCIGFTVGALLGVLVARREQQKLGRLILFIGDGSLQMTVQVGVFVIVPSKGY